ncbi:hypothetical protein QOL99_15390 [Deinococcus sp. MIMF12]|uniref:DUF308 domain-containing protein n=1 Tax=Deinococcus rhizophilus TaxID=3049544 RepID=A0ABT7JKD5_9DEIO|nr:hypothetical protein [Deinococcus rhizophilus]MDL2345522.1 hypothetical protein [Deinococcus rhizophilus]
MRSSSGTNALWGWLLLGTGLLALLGNLEVWSGVSATLWGVVFALGSVLFLGLALRRAGDWWAFIPGGVLLGLTLAVVASGAAWGGAAFLASVGAGFLAIAARHPEHWWAVIPGGAVVSLSLAAAFPGQAAGPLLFFGLAATFLGLAALPTARARGATHRWAWYPAAGTLALAVLSGGWISGLLALYWPVALIVLGGALLLAQRPGRS